MIALKAVLAFIKKWWKFILFPIGVIVWFIGRASGKTTVVVASPALEEHAELQRKLDEQTAQKKAAAEVTRKSRDAAIQDRHEATMGESHQRAEKAVEAYSTEPIDLTEYLKRVGKDVRQQKN